MVQCGCQATGGNFTDWRISLAGGWDDVRNFSEKNRENSEKFPRSVSLSQNANQTALLF